MDMKDFLKIGIVGGIGYYIYKNFVGETGGPQSQADCPAGQQFAQSIMGPNKCVLLTGAPATQGIQPAPVPPPPAFSTPLPRPVSTVNSPHPTPTATVPVAPAHIASSYSDDQIMSLASVNTTWAQQLPNVYMTWDEWNWYRQMYRENPPPGSSFDPTKYDIPIFAPEDMGFDHEQTFTAIQFLQQMARVVPSLASAGIGSMSGGGYGRRWPVMPVGAMRWKQ